MRPIFSADSFFARTPDGGAILLGAEQSVDVELEAPGDGDPEDLGPLAEIV